MAQNAGNQVLDLKIFRGSMPHGPPSRPLGFTFGPVGSKVIENPALRPWLTIKIAINWPKMQEIKCSILKFSGGAYPDPPRRPVVITFWPVGSRVIENPAKDEKYLSYIDVPWW
ncbi:hypothetical protein DPMN_124253 [Dreissena polymorpha]|uniref:Uncharacterized protein n=1 Tax=Dreissena polymorpha TaxID=45954 RepID=A0A9D4GSC5_DREPO|nr:hypothetical protein DPMN_124253 [Dreissena polymorpha]